MRNEYNPVCRNDLIQWRIAQLGTNPRAIANNSNRRLAQMTVVRASRGLNISALKLRMLAEEIDLDPKYLLDFKLKRHQFHRAVVTTRNGATKR